MARAPIQAIVLAAGKSSRFKSETPKLLFTLCGQEMIIYPLKQLHNLAIPTTVVLGHKKELMRRTIEEYGFTSLTCVEQQQQRGTGDAVATTVPLWSAENILILNGDIPLIRAELLQQLIETHREHAATVSFISAHNDDPLSSAGYGRVITENGITKIIESRDFTGDYGTYPYINGGIYLFKRDFLKEYINTLQTHDNSQERYLTDLIEIASQSKLPVTTVKAPFDMIRGVNTLKELWAAEQIQRAEIIEYWMGQGVRFIHAQSTHIDLDVTIGAGSCIGSGVQLLKGTRIGKQSYIGSFSSIQASAIGDYVTIQSHTIIDHATVAEHAAVGPFAHIRNNSVIGTRSVIGNFTEITKSSIAHGTKMKHFGYIGNADIGSQVNIGAGIVCCNYDGTSKHTTTIESHAFIGGNNSLVAPVTIGSHAMTAAGSVITHDVPAQALAIGRAHQINKENYVQKLRSSMSIGGAVKTREPNPHE